MITLKRDTGEQTQMSANDEELLVDSLYAIRERKVRVVADVNDCYPSQFTRADFAVMAIDRMLDFFTGEMK